MRVLKSLFILLTRSTWLCFHSRVTLRWNKDGRLWTQCLRCGNESCGVQFGPYTA